MAQLTRTPLSRGYLLKGYRIESVIGGGGFSLVYLAYHIRSQAKVVIKEYYPEDLVVRLPGGRLNPVGEEVVPAFQIGIQRFFEEARALAGLKHPNIVNVSNIFRTNHTVYMVMDYAQGRDLRWYIKRSNGRLSERFVHTVFPQVAMGLDVLHRNGFLHLDVKPANILLRSEGNPLLLDFGAVQQFKEGMLSGGVQTLTHGFAPPEQYRGADFGPWTDIYGLGATIFGCITGRPPPAALEREEKDRMRPVTRSHRHRYTKELLTAVEWALQLDHRYRPPNINTFLKLALTGAPQEFIDKLVAKTLMRHARI